MNIRLSVWKEVLGPTLYVWFSCLYQCVYRRVTNILHQRQQSRSKLHMVSHSFDLLFQYTIAYHSWLACLSWIIPSHTPPKKTKQVTSRWFKVTFLYPNVGGHDSLRPWFRVNFHHAKKVTVTKLRYCLLPSWRSRTQASPPAFFAKSIRAGQSKEIPQPVDLNAFTKAGGFDPKKSWDLKSPRGLEIPGDPAKNTSQGFVRDS